MTAAQAATGVEVTELTEEELWAIIDREATQMFNISGEEFARRWSEGEFRDCDDPRILQVAILLPDAW